MKVEKYISQNGREVTLYKTKLGVVMYVEATGSVSLLLNGAEDAIINFTLEKALKEIGA